MNQSDFTRRMFMQTAGAAAAVTAAGAYSTFPAQAAGPLKIWTIGVAKVGGKDWSAMEKQAGIKVTYSAKSGSASEAIQKMVVGDGNKLYDAMTDNGGGMEDALASQKVIVPIDTSKISNWKNVQPRYNPGGAAASTIRHKGKLYAVPYISNADSLAFNHGKIGQELTSWEALFDSQFRGRASMQNDFGPTLTNTAIYLKQSGKHDIKNPSNMSPKEVEWVCKFLIDLKKKKHFRTFWNGFGNGLSLLASEEVLVSSCWEPIQVVAAKKSGKDIRYGTMKEGHQAWNNVWMLTRGGQQRGQSAAFYKLMNLYLSPWFGARTLAGLGFTPQMGGVMEYVKANPATFNAAAVKAITDRMKRKEERIAVKGNSWQNVFPKNLRAYQDWWARVQAA